MRAGGSSVNPVSPAGVRRNNISAMHVGARARHKLDRLVFFSDAVFAIAITLLDIDLHVPDRLPALTNAGLTQALTEVVPALIGFALSFTVVGVFWVSHHRAFGLLACSVERLLRRNLVFLFTIALTLFPTGLTSHFQPFPIAQQIHTGALFLAACCNCVSSASRSRRGAISRPMSILRTRRGSCGALGRCRLAPRSHSRLRPSRARRSE
jgi:uncharacterized membrane protein